MQACNLALALLNVFQLPAGNLQQMHSVVETAVGCTHCEAATL